LFLFLQLVLPRLSNASTLDDSPKQPTVLKGTVTDSFGAIIPGASVEAKNTNSQKVTQATTGPTGHYSLTVLAAVSLRGNYCYAKEGIRQ
jgi:hypothetical protein